MEDWLKCEISPLVKYRQNQNSSAIELNQWESFADTSLLSYTMDTCSILTRPSNPPISQFNSPCNEFLSVCSMFASNTCVLFLHLYILLYFSLLESTSRKVENTLLKMETLSSLNSMQELDYQPPRRSDLPKPLCKLYCLNHKVVILTAVSFT
mgnify:CR=1 FL=1